MITFNRRRYFKKIFFIYNESPENKLFAVVTGKRKREVGLVVPAKYVALTKSKTFTNVLQEKLEEKKKNNPHGSLFERGAYLRKPTLRVGAYSRGGLFGSGGLIDHLRYMVFP